jgi:hypothetical protein
MLKMTYDPRQLAKIKKMLEDLPKGAISVVIPAINSYLIGDESHGLKHEPAYREVSRTSAYGFPFFTDKQRKWFFANLDDLNVGQDNRTGHFSAGWKVRGDLYRQTIYNDVPYGKWLMSEGQARQPAKVGWRKVSEVVASNIKGAIKHAYAKLGEWLRKKNYARWF